MLKDIEWLKEQIGLVDLRWGESKGSEFFRGFSAALDITKNLVNQMDDPKPLIIPHFVADWIESKKKKGDKFARVMLNFHNNSIEYSINKYIDNNYETFAMAWLVDNYTIEKEPEWIVFYSQYRNKCFKDFKGINGFKYGSFKEAIKFTSKEKAEAVALLTGGNVEEVDEYEFI